MDISKAVRDILSKNKSIEEALAGASEGELETAGLVLEAIKAKLTKSMAGEMPASGGYMIKIDKNGQWKMEKAIKPGAPLDYSKMNPKPDYDKIDREAPKVDYSNQSSVPKTQPKPWAGARAKRDAALAGAGMKSMGKEEGVNIEKEPTPEQKKKMTL